MDLPDQSDDLAPFAGAWRQHDRRSALDVADCLRLKRRAFAFVPHPWEKPRRVPRRWRQFLKESRSDPIVRFQISSQRTFSLRLRLQLWLATRRAR